MVIHSPVYVVPCRASHHHKKYLNENDFKVKLLSLFEIVSFIPNKIHNILYNNLFDFK